ncbi:hypothetical protein D3C76_1452640 [compost metagenome]
MDDSAFQHADNSNIQQSGYELFNKPQLETPAFFLPVCNGNFNDGVTVHPRQRRQVTVHPVV